jgi:hypothetical protein
VTAAAEAVHDAATSALCQRHYDTLLHQQAANLCSAPADQFVAVVQLVVHIPSPPKPCPPTHTRSITPHSCALLQQRAFVLARQREREARSGGARGANTSKNRQRRRAGGSSGSGSDSELSGFIDDDDDDGGWRAQLRATTGAEETALDDAADCAALIGLGTAPRVLCFIYHTAICTD